MVPKHLQSLVASAETRLGDGLQVATLLQKRVNRGSIQRGALTDRRDPLPAGITKTNSVHCPGGSPDFRAASGLRGKWSLWRRHAGTTKTAKPPIPVEHCRPRQKGHTRRREKTTANVIPQLCFGCLVCLLSVHRTLSLPGLVGDCRFILSLLYKSACLVPSTRGPASTLPVC